MSHDINPGDIPPQEAAGTTDTERELSRRVAELEAAIRQALATSAAGCQDWRRVLEEAVTWRG